MAAARRCASAAARPEATVSAPQGNTRHRARLACLRRRQLLRCPAPDPALHLGTSRQQEATPAARASGCPVANLPDCRLSRPAGAESPRSADGSLLGRPVQRARPTAPAAPWAPGRALLECGRCSSCTQLVCAALAAAAAAAATAARPVAAQAPVDCASVSPPPPSSR